MPSKRRDRDPYRAPKNPPIPEPPQLPALASVKSCNVCGKELPLGAQYFDRDNEKPDGFRDTCKQCRKEKREESLSRKEEADLQKRVALLDRAALKTLDSFVHGGSDVPHTAEVYQQIMEAFGGSRGLAQHVMAQYLTSHPGSPGRTKILAEVLKLANKVTESGAAKIPLELMDDDDLEALRLETERRIATQRHTLYVGDENDEEDGNAEKAG